MGGRLGQEMDHSFKLREVNIVHFGSWSGMSLMCSIKNEKVIAAGIE